MIYFSISSFCKKVAMKNKKKLKRWFSYLFLIGASFFILLFFLTATLIGRQVKERCYVAESQYEGDCVEALIQVVDGDYNSFDSRNRAIWALGQLGDIRAEEVLEKYYTGTIPDREPYDQDLSQYELKKALKLVRGGFNATHCIWR